MHTSIVMHRLCAHQFNCWLSKRPPLRICPHLPKHDIKPVHGQRKIQNAYLKRGGGKGREAGREEGPAGIGREGRRGGREGGRVGGMKGENRGGD